MAVYAYGLAASWYARRFRVLESPYRFACGAIWPNGGSGFEQGIHLKVDLWVVSTSSRFHDPPSSSINSWLVRGPGISGHA